MPLTEQEKQQIKKEEVTVSNQASTYVPPIKPKRTPWWVWVLVAFFGLLVFFGFFSGVANRTSPPTNSGVVQEQSKQGVGTKTPAELAKLTATTTPAEQKETKILQEQQAKAESLTKTAVGLITEDKMAEANALYNARWSELAKLRAEILYDKELTDVQKKNIDNALKAEQEGITNILSKYEQLYP